MIFNILKKNSTPPGSRAVYNAALNRRFKIFGCGMCAALCDDMRDPETKIYKLHDLHAERARLKKAGKTLVFTNGCFDLLHAGHVTYLNFARRQGDALLLGLNSDVSVRRNKGPQRPVNPQARRALVAAALECVDYVVIFEEDEPADLIKAVTPDVLVKGADWAHYVSGREWVERNGGKVVLAPMVEGLSSSNIIERVRDGRGV